MEHGEQRLAQSTDELGGRGYRLKSIDKGDCGSSTPFVRLESASMRCWMTIVYHHDDQSTWIVVVWTGYDEPKISPWWLPIAVTHGASAPLGGGVTCGAWSERWVNRCLCCAYGSALGGEWPRAM